VRTFSRQTFRADYGDKKPHLNTQLAALLISGIGLRQSARILPLSRKCTELKARKLARHAKDLNRRLRGQLPEPTRLQFDEIESYESRRRERPITFPIVIEPESRFIIWGESAPLAPKGRMNRRRKKAIEHENKLHGKRISKSNEAVKRALDQASALVLGTKELFFETDEKKTYPKLIREAFPNAKISHSQTSSKLIRDVKNPLFPINHTEAMARDLMGRLRRDSWLVSKARKYLDLAFQLFMAWKNYVRPRFNREHCTPAEVAGFTLRPVTMGEVFGWRQDWGERSPKVGPGVHAEGVK